MTQHKSSARSPVSFQVEISPGELLDRISILQIKSEHITDPAKLSNVKSELNHFAQIAAEADLFTGDIASLAQDLKRVNQILWDVEDQLRDMERRQDFGQEFIRLARMVYQTNDERARLKRVVNDRLGSRFIEEKSYSASP